MLLEIFSESSNVFLNNSASSSSSLSDLFKPLLFGELSKKKNNKNNYISLMINFKMQLIIFPITNLKQIYQTRHLLQLGNLELEVHSFYVYLFALIS